jgi:hypothetical protein
VERVSHNTIGQELKKVFKPWLKPSWCIGKLDGEYLMEALLHCSRQALPAIEVRRCFDERPCPLIDERLLTHPGKVAKQDDEGGGRNEMAQLAYWPLMIPTKGSGRWR